MSVVHEHLETVYPLGWRYSRFEAPTLPPRSHVHPEFELTHIVRGVGTRLVGESIEQYEPGDLVLIGPHLAHTYASLPGGGPSEAVVVHFTRDFLGEGFFDLPVFGDVAVLLDAAVNGLRFAQVPDGLAVLGDLAPAERTVALLEVLVALSRQPYVWLTTGQAPSLRSATAARRTEAIVAYVHEHYAEPIALRDVARAARLSPSAASRFFARSNGFTLTRFITIVRLNAACRLLRDTDRTIADIAAACGFGNLSNFNRRFRQVKAVTPKQCRVLLRAGQGQKQTREHLPNVKRSKPRARA